MIGQSFGHYRIDEQLGAGGMGVVYRATDTVLGRTVALKFLAPDHADPAHRDRLMREAKIASGLSHPNIAHIYEIVSADDALCIAMEFVDGRRLDQVIAGQPMASTDIVDIAVQIADALDAAHAKGIVHRDIKPANVMLTGRRQVKVLDFGLAKREGPAPSRSDASTNATSEAGLILGTVSYMSPEQAWGRPVDIRSDIFSLGAVLYEMATGRQAFQGLSSTETIERIAHAEPEAMARFNYALPPEFERIVRKCLEKDPGRRYQTPRDLAVDLQNFKRDSDSGTRVVPTRRRSSRTLIAAAAILILGAGAWGAWLLYTGGGPSIDSVAVLPFVNTAKDPALDYLTDGLAESLINDLTAIPGLRVVPRGIAFRYRDPNIDPKQIAEALGVRAILTGRVVERSGALNIQVELTEPARMSQLWGDQFDRPVADLLTVQREITREIVQTIRPRLTGEERGMVTKQRAANNEAYQAYLKGRYQWGFRTPEGFRRGIQFFEDAIRADPSYAQAYAGLADSYSLLARYSLELPRMSFPKAKEAAERALAIDPSLAEPHASLAYVACTYDWQWPRAQEEFEKAIALAPDYATAHHWYGLCLSAMGQPDRAASEINRALTLDPVSLIINSNRARLSYYARRFDEALDLHRKAIALNPDWSESSLRMGWTLAAAGRSAEAIAAFEKARQLQPSSATTSALGYGYARAGRRRDAEQLLTTLSADASRTFVSNYDLAVLSLGLGNLDQTFKSLAKAFDERASLLIYLKVDPIFDGVRDDRRFQDLVVRVGLR
jgi:eukaryotic-like serine/threonine-protein kinase